MLTELCTVFLIFLSNIYDLIFPMFTKEWDNAETLMRKLEISFLDNDLIHRNSENSKQIILTLLESSVTFAHKIRTVNDKDESVVELKVGD